MFYTKKCNYYEYIINNKEYDLEENKNFINEVFYEKTNSLYFFYLY